MKKNIKKNYYNSLLTYLPTSLWVSIHIKHSKHRNVAQYKIKSGRRISRAE